MQFHMFRSRCLTLILVASSCTISPAGAGPETGRARIALFQPAGQNGDTTLDAVLSAVADSMELSLAVLQRYEVTRLPSADPAKDLDRVRAYCQENRIDQAILGSGNARAGGGYRFRLVVYDRKTDKVTTDQQGTSTGVLDMFDVTDALVASLLYVLSGTHVLFGSLYVESHPVGATVLVNDKEVGLAPLSLRGLPVGVVTLTARMDGCEEEKATVTIVDGQTTTASLKLPSVLLKLAENGTPQEVRDAIDKGANVNDQDENGWTPLILAAERNPNPDVIEMLLNAGADATIRDPLGRTAFWFAHGNEKLKGTDAYLQLQKASQQ